MAEFRGNYCGDIYGGKGDIILVTAVVFVVAILVSLLVADISDSEVESAIQSVEKFNVFAEEFNALDESVREQVYLAGVLSHNFETSEEEQWLAQIRTYEGRESGWWWRVGFLWALAICAVATSIAMFSMFLYHWCKDHFMVDLPFKEYPIFCRLLLVICFVGWPAFLVSAIRMQIQKRRFRKAEQAECLESLEETAESDGDENNTEETSEDEQENENDDDEPKEEWTTAEDVEAVSFEHRKKSAKRLYKKFRLACRQSIIDKKIQEHNENIESTRHEMRGHAEQIQLLQREVNTETASLRKLERIEVSDDVVSIRQAENEFIKLLKMRGVVAVRAEDDSIYIRINVRVEYDGELYDFGDWLIMLYESHFESLRLRSGVRSDWGDDGYPDYANGDDTFCFGERRESIEKFLQAGQHIEALTIIIDSLHSVNSDSDEEDIPNCFKKVVKGV